MIRTKPCRSSLITSVVWGRRKRCRGRLPDIMSGVPQFAIVQKGDTRPPVEALKRAFASFTNLTETDAVRLSGGAPGFLLRQLRRDAAQALQRDLNAAGIATVLV